MRINAELKVDYSNERLAESVSKSVEVDNYSDSSLSIKTKRKDCEVRTEINLKLCENESKGVSTLSNTINDLILSIKTSEELLK